MTGYNLWLIFPVDEAGWQEEPMFLCLSYSTYNEADLAKCKLEEVYGAGRVEIEAHSRYMAIAE